MTRTFLFLFTILACHLEPNTIFAEEDFSPRRVLSAVDPIIEPKTVEIGDAGKWVRDNELVLGVVIGEESRAYPINMLTSPSREIINDKLGGRSIAATW